MFSKLTLRTLLFLFVIGSMVLAACAQPAAPTPEAEPKVATFIFTQEFDTLNPLYSSMWFSAITHQLWNCWPWDFDDLNQPRPVLVTEMPSADNGGISADGRTITMKLRDGIAWSDGTAITPDDFIFTYEMTIEPKNTVAAVSPYDLIESVTAPDEKTVVTTFKEPYAPWMFTLWHGIIPAHVLKPVFEADGTLDNAEWNRAPTVSCGPFVFQEWESGSFARFVANDTYWAGRPKLDEVFIRFVPDDASQIAALKAGDGDLGTFLSWSDLPDLEAAGIEILKANSGFNEGFYFYLNEETAHPALKDVRVRLAIAYGTNRAAIVQDLLLGGTNPAATMWDNTPYVDPSLQPYPFDPDKAKALLDEAGWTDTTGDGTRDKDGEELVLTYGTTTREIRRDTQAAVQQQLADIGIGVELLNFDSDIFFGGYGEGGPAATGQFDIFEYSTVTQYPDPDTYDFLCSEIPSDEYPAGTNWTGYCDPDLDALFQQQTSQVDTAVRQQTFYQISKMIYDKVYWLGLWQDPDLWGLRGTIQNAKISGVTPFYNIIEWDLVK
jgi:peptide/nickel transport system substrate-binding protein